MLYFAELDRKQVLSSDRKPIGRLKDLVFRAQDQPIVTKLVVHADTGIDVFVPVHHIRKINSHIELMPDFQSVSLSENELYIKKNLLNQQIIDINGNKVVRVNDVAIQEKPTFLIAGVDIGLLGLLRWLKIEKGVNLLASRIGKTVTSRFLSWADIQPLELATGRVVLNKEEEKLERIRPEDLADHLEKMNLRNITRILDMLQDDFEAEVIQNLNLSYQQSLFRHFKPQRSAEILALIDPDDAVDILLTLPEEKRTEIVAMLPEDKRKEITHLLKLSKTEIGGLITSEFLTVGPDDTVSKVLSVVRSQSGDFSTLRYVYVVNNQKQLVGAFNLHELLIQHPDTPAYRFMGQNLIVAYLSTPEEIAIKKMLKYKLMALPVIDEKKQILGVVTWDDLTESVIQHLT